MNDLLRLAMDASVRAIALALGVGAILALARARSGAVRHAAWTAVLCAMPLMLVLPRLTPGIALPAGPAPAIRYPAPAYPFVAEPVGAPAQTTPATAQSPVRVAPAPLPPGRPFPWPLALSAAYLAIALSLLGRLMFGWRSARSLVPAAEPLALQMDGAPVRQSAAVATPLAVGVLQPCILLPSVWASWPEAKLRAVLAHEAAHVRRRDALVTLAARINRCVFWFHPLAWWLERELAASAEMAADEAAVHAVGEGAAYAKVLLEMADAVRRSGGRLACEGVAMDGVRLERRIERILRADFLGRISRTRKSAVAIGCAAAIFLAAACRDKSKSDAALVAQAESRKQERSAKFERYQAAQRAERDFMTAAGSMSREQVAAMEAALRERPDDFDSRKKLLAHYHEAILGPPLRLRPSQAPPAPGIDPPSAKPLIAGALPHYFWMIEHHPEDTLLARIWEGVFPNPVDPRPDPANRERAKKLWLEQANRDGRPSAVYVNAAEFFQKFDKPTAEKMLLRARAADPKGESLGTMYGGDWSARMGDFDARLLRETKLAAEVASGDPVRTFLAQMYGPVDPSGPYAAEVRQKLLSSKDVTMLLSAASELVGMGVASSADIAFGKTLIQRALTVHRDSTWARQLLNMAADQEATANLPKEAWQGPLESRHRAIEALSPGERFRELANLAIAAGDEGVRADVIKHDAAAEKAAWQQAGKYAQEALDMASQARTHADYGTAFFTANMILGTAAMKAGDPKSAAQYLLKAADASATDALKYPIVNARPWAMNWHYPAFLAAQLLKAGERDAVLKFMERYSGMVVVDRDRWLEDTALIRQGKLPSWERKS